MTPARDCMLNPQFNGFLFNRFQIQQTIPDTAISLTVSVKYPHVANGGLAALDSGF